MKLKRTAEIILAIGAQNVHYTANTDDIYIWENGVLQFTGVRTLSHPGTPPDPVIVRFSGTYYITEPVIKSEDVEF
jgi:hypothetical protein